MPTPTAHSGAHSEVVGRIATSDPQRNQRIDAWRASVSDMHRAQPTPRMVYRHPMPDVEELMQVCVCVLLCVCACAYVCVECVVLAPHA